MSEPDRAKSKDAAPYGLPPQNIEAEESIISAILIDNNALLDVIEALGPDDFYRTAHQKIYAAMTDLFDKAEPIDLVTLANKLKEKGQLDEIGGATIWMLNGLDQATEDGALAFMNASAPSSVA